MYVCLSVLELATFCSVKLTCSSTALDETETDKGLGVCGEPGDAGRLALETKSSVAENSSGGIERKSTRLWAEDSQYDTSKLFNKACYSPALSVIAFSYL